MKKLLNILLVTGLIGSVSLSLSSCGKETMKVAILNSRDPIKTIKAMKPLEKAISQKLKSYNKEYNINLKFVNTGDYDAGAEALRNGTAAFSYMSMETYLKARGGDNINDEPKAAPLVIVQTDTFKADHEIYTAKGREGLKECLEPFKGNDQLDLLKKYDEILNNAKKDGKFNFQNRDQFNNAVMQNKEGSEKAQYYRSFIYASNKLLKEKEYNLQKIKNIEEYNKKTKELIEHCFSKNPNDGKEKNKIICKKGNDSLSGFLYPLLIMNELGIGGNEENGWGDSWENFKKEIKKINRENDYPKIAEMLADENKEIIAFGFSDIRRELSGNSDLMNKALENSTVIGVSEGIHEAGIHYSKVWMKNRKKDDNFVQALRRAFKELMDEGNYKKEFGFYNHTSYEIPDNKNNNNALQWEKDWDSRYFKSSKKLEKIKKLITDNN